MAEPNIFNIIAIAVLVLIILLAVIYLIPIIFIRRFHTVNNLFTLNLAVAAICCSVYWLTYFVLFIFYTYALSDSRFCAILDYFQMVCSLQVPLAIVATSLHRLCSIVYMTKPYFKKKRWGIICISGQWIACIVLSVPQISFNNPECSFPLWRKIYTLILLVIIPSIICLINNILIFQHVRNSTNRIQPLGNDGKDNQRQQISDRDLHLLRHMIIMFCFFIGGWTPIYLYTCLVSNMNFNETIPSLFVLFAEFSLLMDIADLYLYNREWRRFCIEKFR
ncbi:unnamed protein product [Adineta ricciae]|uniref:G-protein coupled receptors family 1 profile domain-containing protein n=1 Tax=Adineta ricciae TaxID=249248 RepID=A0A813MQV6_ADIRI|nr:unnamed protein product [Adineta ricciae]CAF1230194.1 unnamed protein product [Adineta ricciae]